MSVNVNNKAGLVDSVTPGYSACGCGNRRYYTKAEIDEMLADLDLDDMATTGWVEDQGYLTEAILDGYATEEWVDGQGYLKDITLTINGTVVHNNGEIEIEGGGTGGTIDISGKLDTTAFTAAMQAETARTESTYLKEADLTNYALKTYVDDETATAVTSSKTYTDESISAATSDLASKSWVNGTVDGAMAAETARTENTYAKITYVDNAIGSLPTYTDIEYLLQRLSAMQAEIDWMKENCCGQPDTGDTPTPDTGATLSIVYNVTSTTQNTKILNALTGIKSFVVDDGTVVTSPATTYKFNSTGERTITYTLVDNKIPTRSFNNLKSVKRVTIEDSVAGFKGEYGKAGFNMCSNMQKVVIGSGVTEIPAFAFSGCTSVTEVVIGNAGGCSVRFLEGTSFQGCSSLRKISCYAASAPVVFYQAFEGVATNGNLYYPVGSDYSSWLTTPPSNSSYGCLPSGWVGHSTL